tara:strand:- start:2781 stop:3209 length:429 start_codon:yes stop_codon:yes gene_type:complete
MTSFVYRKKEDITELVIHYSASDNALHSDISVIRDWHVINRNFLDVAYHFFIPYSGSIQVGRPELAQGAGVKGYNKHTIHICVHGKTDFKPVQFIMLKSLVERLCEDYPITKALYHRDVDGGKCPNFELEWLKEFNEAIQST